MSLAQKVTNLYLYGQNTTPSDLSDESLIRPSLISPNPVIDIDVQDYMQNGGGRFAIGSQFEIIQKFFDPGIFTPDVPPRIQPYTKQEIAAIFGDSNFFGWNMQQKDIQDGMDDYAERAYVFNTQSFQISDDAKFIVDPTTGDKRIENFAIEPNAANQDDFDFIGGSVLANVIGSIELVPKIDPSGIGRTVDIDYVGTVPRVTYKQSDYETDVIKKIFFQGGNYPKLLSLTRTLVNDLFNSGVTRFIENDKPILYGTTGTDNISAVRNITTGGTPTLFKFKDNGAILIAGKGADTVTGGLYDDVLIGNEENDQLNGQPFLTDSSRGNDIFDAGAGNDTLNGSKGNKDIAIFSDEYTTENYDIETSGLFNKTTTVTHKNNGVDGVDTLKNVEWGSFKGELVDLSNLASARSSGKDASGNQTIAAVAADSGTASPPPRIIPLPLEDGEEDTETVQATDTTANPNPNDPPTPPYVSLTAPVAMLDGDVDYTLNISPYKPDIQHNVVYIIDTSSSIDAVELQTMKDAYTNLTNYFVAQGIAENTNTSSQK